MAIGALAEAGVLLNRPDLVAAATAAAELLVSVHYIAPKESSPVVGTARILRTSKDGVAGPSAGLLEDYACVAAGLLKLSGVTGEARWATVAVLLETVLTAFADGNGGFYDTADHGERLIFRPADPTDNATPSGAFAAADALLSYGALTGEERFREAAVGALKVLPPIAARYPRAGGWASRWRKRCFPGRPRSRSSARTTTRAPPTCCGRPCMWPRRERSSRWARARRRKGQRKGTRSRCSTLVPWFQAGRRLNVCRGFTCQAPVTTPAAVREAVRLALPR